MNFVLFNLNMDTIVSTLDKDTEQVYFIQAEHYIIIIKYCLFFLYRKGEI